MDRPTREAVARAHQAAKQAEAARKDLRRRTQPGDKPRQERLTAEIDRLRVAMGPLRSVIGRLPYSPLGPSDERAVRRASEALKYQRKQIRKMQR